MLFTLLPALFYALASTAGAMLYPAFMSFKAIKSGKETRKWLEYWIVYGLYGVLEWAVVDNLVSTTWLVAISKLVFLGWLVFHGGAAQIYQSSLEKQLVQHEKAIDQALEKASDYLTAKGLELKASGMELVKKHAGSLFQILAAKGAADADPKAGAKPDAKASGKAE